MEAGGSGPIGDGELRSQDSDIRHLLSFFFDVVKLDESQMILQQMRWVDHLGLLNEKTSQKYPTQFGKIFFRLYDNRSLANQAESHLSIQEVRQIREKCGLHKLYADYAVPSHYFRYKNITQYDVVQEPKETNQSRIQKMMQRAREQQQQQAIRDEEESSVQQSAPKIKIKPPPPEQSDDDIDEILDKKRLPLNRNNLQRVYDTGTTN